MKQYVHASTSGVTSRGANPVPPVVRIRLSSWSSHHSKRVSCTKHILRINNYNLDLKFDGQKYEFEWQLFKRGSQSPVFEGRFPKCLRPLL